uniref:Uncharacterized protein n=1 Tax=Cannabis sativa TaxID=3483 RepID=A0A803P3L8_CANSA
MNTIDVVNPVTVIGATSFANTAGQPEVSISVDPSGRVTPPRVDPPLAPSREGKTHERQPPSKKTGPQLFYAGETSPRVGKSTIGEPHFDLGEDLEFSRLKEVVGCVGLTKEPSAADCDSFAQ